MATIIGDGHGYDRVVTVGRNPGTATDQTAGVGAADGTTISSVDLMISALRHDRPGGVPPFLSSHRKALAEAIRRP
ncbi:MAG: hypothetical protein RLZZ444_4277 [Pseudomonadota bacterium]|jgi:hypothetical protein